ncbi:glutamate--tRNA ligase family protein, partial [Mycoplasmopsis synoviae]|uniref:glutamate--tRNA ligase family protein n=1 Tax=Mycoplasmopsis synoviae TaxID=2109 RepID=UPI00387B9D9F
LKYGKYRQTEKLHRYKEVLDMLLEKNFAYKAYDLPGELQAQQLESEQKRFASFRYDPSWLKNNDEGKAKRDLNNQFSYHNRMPKVKPFSWNDLVRGEISFS